MKFLHLFHKEVEFENIEDDIKDIIRRALDAENNYNLLFIGPPASAKTLFLLGVLDMRKDGVYFDGSNTTNRILDVLEEERPKIICIDELDKMSRTFENQLLNFMESGRVKLDQQKKQYDFEIKGAKVFATCNEINRLSKPLQSRFRKLFLPRYTEQQFLNVSENVLPKLSSSLARYIGAAVWKSDKFKDYDEWQKGQMLFYKNQFQKYRERFGGLPLTDETRGKLREFLEQIRANPSPDTEDDD